MATALLVLHLMIATALVAVVLLQRSEGGALGIGGGGGGGGAGGLLTGRGTANLLTRTTALLALAFFTTSILLSLVAQKTVPNKSLLDAGGAASTSAPASADSQPAQAPADGGRGGILDKLQSGRGGAPAVPQSR
jgi:preprotein translocase subunit SecG